MRKQKLATPNEIKNLQASLLLNTNLDDNLNRISLFWLSDNEEDNISDIEDLGSQ